MKREKDYPVVTRQSSLTRLAAWGVVAGLVFVPLLFGLAMAAFPAGHHGALNGYSFSKHVVSDLGRTCISNGARNTLSCGLFAAAMALTGAVCALFWLVRSVFLSHSVARRVALTGGVMMSVLMAAIGFTPLNIVAKIHDPVTGATAIAAALAVLTVFMDRTDRLERPVVKYTWLVVMFAVLSIWTVLVALHHEHLLAFRPWLPVGQKVLIATFIAWMAYQASLLFKVER